MYCFVRKIVDFQSTKKCPCLVDCREAWEPQTPGHIRVCPGSSFSYRSTPFIRCYFVTLIFCKEYK